MLSFLRLFLLGVSVCDQVCRRPHSAHIAIMVLPRYVLFPRVPHPSLSSWSQHTCVWVWVCVHKGTSKKSYNLGLKTAGKRQPTLNGVAQSSTTVREMKIKKKKKKNPTPARFLRNSSRSPLKRNKILAPWVTGVRRTQNVVIFFNRGSIVI